MSQPWIADPPNWLLSSLLKHCQWEERALLCCVSKKWHSRLSGCNLYWKQLVSLLVQENRSVEACAQRADKTATAPVQCHPVCSWRLALCADSMLIPAQDLSATGNRSFWTCGAYVIFGPSVRVLHRLLQGEEMRSDLITRVNALLETALSCVSRSVSVHASALTSLLRANQHGMELRHLSCFPSTSASRFGHHLQSMLY